MIELEMEVRNEIKQQLLALAAHYQLPEVGLEKILASPLLEDYVEIVLCEDQLEVVLGGMGREADLQEMALAHGFPAEVVEAFAACAARFPDKMLYSKFSPSAEIGAGSMYFVLLEPWENVVEFLGSLGFSASVLAQLQQAVSGNRICFLLGFTHDPSKGGLSIKAYHLFDRDVPFAGPKPFLISYRFGKNQFDPQPKVYFANAKWQEFGGQAPWAALSALGNTLFGERHAVLRGVSDKGSEKAYIFRHDRREGDTFNLKSYNYYVEEGNRLIEIGELALAEKSFRQAVDYSPLDFDAWNRLGYVILMQGRHLEGIGHVLHAKSLQPHITNLIWVWSNQVAEQDDEIARLTRELALEPTVLAYNARAIYYFHKRMYDEAKADLLASLEIDALHSETYNNLGGVCIKQGEFVEAVKYCMNAHSINRATNTANLIICREAIRLIKLAEEAPSHDSLTLLGKYYYQLDFFEKAQACFAQALEFAPLPMA